MEDFLELARDNTNKDVETCGVLGASLVRFTLLKLHEQVHLLSLLSVVVGNLELI